MVTMHPNHRKIEPAPLPQGGVRDTPGLSVFKKKKRIVTRVACSRCRIKRISCNGNRPSCYTCAQRGDVCQYETGSKDETRQMATNRQLIQLKARLKQHEDIMRHLQEAPGDEALATIRQLRSTPGLEMVLASLGCPIAPQRPSDLETARATLPCTQSSIEFELAVQHGNAYPALAKIDTSTVDVGSIFERRTSFVLPYASTNALLEHYEVTSTKPEPTKTLVTGPPSPLRGIVSRPSSSALGPLQGRVYCDPRLQKVRFQYWTQVAVSDEFAASILSVYLENEHAVIGTFDTDIFLDDLADGRLDFCCSFLVSSLLGLASLCFASIDSRALSLATAFLAEAESLWQAERVSDSITNLAAIITLGIATMMHGKDEISQDLFADGRCMAERMCLIGARHSHQLSKQFHQLSPRSLRAVSHAAWGCYNCLSAHASYHPDEPIAFPPILPIPGSSVNASGGGWPAHRLPDYLGQTFGESCKLWTISQEIRAAYYRRDATPLQGAIPLAFAESKYQKLLSWANNLTPGMTRKEQSFPHVAVLHAYCHIIILDLFRPFLKVSEPIRLKSFASQDSTPKAIFDASLGQLQRILLDYTTRYDPRLYNFYLDGAIFHVVHVTLNNSDLQGWRLNLALGMGWMKEAFARFAVIGKVAQAYMAIDMESGMIPNLEAREFVEGLQRRGRHHDLADVAASCIVDFEVAMSSKHAGRAQDLGQRFDELALFDEFIKTE